MKDNKEYTIEQLSGDGLRGLEILYKAVYGRSCAKTHFDKKYNTAYTGAENIGFIAYNSARKPVAFFGVIPCFVQYQERRVIAAQAADAMTHPEHRYKGIFIKLVRQTMELCREKKIQFVFGFPNQNSYQVLVQKLKWKVVGYMDRFSIPVNTFPLESLLARWACTKWIYKQYANLILSKYIGVRQELPGLVLCEGPGVPRDGRYIHYKSYNDTYIVKLGKANVWIRIKNGLLIGDADLKNADFDTTMETMMAVARRLGVATVAFQTSPGTQLHTLLTGRYTAIRSFPIVTCDLGTEIPLKDLRFTFADIDIF